MTTNTEWFARYLRVTREHFEYSQQAVATAGGPHRQLQAAIESGDEPDVSVNVMAMFDRAYGWPVGYTQALAELGQYASTNELSDALLGDDHDRAALLDHRYEEAPSGVVRILCTCQQDSGPISIWPSQRRAPSVVFRVRPTSTTHNPLRFGCKCWRSRCGRGRRVAAHRASATSG